MMVNHQYRGPKLKPCGTPKENLGTCSPFCFPSFTFYLFVVCREVFPVFPVGLYMPPTTSTNHRVRAPVLFFGHVKPGMKFLLHEA